MYIVKLSSNGDHHVFYPCMLQTLSVTCMFYDLCAVINFVIQYSLPPKG
jgi:hypothetical protein